MYHFIKAILFILSLIQFTYFQLKQKSSQYLFYQKPINYFKLGSLKIELSLASLSLSFSFYFPPNSPNSWSLMTTLQVDSEKDSACIAATVGQFIVIVHHPVSQEGIW